MRKALLVLAAGLVMGSWANADEATWKWDGQIRSRYESISNQKLIDTTNDSADTGNTWVQRAKVGTTVAKGENLTGYVSLLAAFTWGNDLPSDNTDASGHIDNNEVLINEAWIWWRANDMFSVKAGRGGMELAHGLVVSKFDYAQYPYVFDGILATLDFNFGTFGIFGVKGEDDRGTGQVASDPETNYYGVSFGMKNLPDAISTVHAHYMNINQDVDTAAATSNFQGSRYGIALGGDLSFGLDWRADYAAQSGKWKDFSGDGDVTDDEDLSMNSSMYDLEVGYTVANAMNLRFFAGYHSDTGDDEEATGTADDDTFSRYSGFYYDQHKYAGYMDLFKFGNLTYYNIGATFEPMESLTVGLNYLMFNRTTEDDNEAASGDIRADFGTAGADTNDEKVLGSEIDLWVEKAYEGGLKLGARYGMFTPGAFFKHDDFADEEKASKNASEIEFTASLDF